MPPGVDDQAYRISGIQNLSSAQDDTSSTIKYTGTGFFFRELKKVYFLYPKSGNVNENNFK